MPLPGRIFPGDEELGKKNDDHRPTHGGGDSYLWPIWKSALRPPRRRSILILLFLIGAYIFFKHIPPLTDQERANRFGNALNGLTSSPSTDAPTNAPPRLSGHSEAEKHFYDGQVRFFKLAASLHASARFGGYHEINKNVLFAVSSLKSASELLPLACEMARCNRNYVHFAFLGREDLPVKDIKSINGVTPDCNINWHDARPDYSPWSSDFRMEVSITAALEHLWTFLHPQVIIAHDPGKEDPFFVSSVRSKTFESGTSLIELPSSNTENAMWITRLDSSSLAAWPTTYVDILIHAPSQSSGSLIRLLKSIEAADYFGARRPHLTIELPADIDRPTSQYLDNFVWPPVDWSGAPHASQVTLRHRITRKRITAEEASYRFIESFYPKRLWDSHVLLLSPQVELSPLYYHYLMYTLLEYRYSTGNSEFPGVDRLIGLSLDLPSTYLNDTGTFTPPQAIALSTKDSLNHVYDPTPFLWQAPNSNAALYFSDKWIEFQSFMSSRLSVREAHLPANKRPLPQPKLVSERYPAWMEDLLEFMRVRGLSLLYPGVLSSTNALVTVHNELYQIPEEFLHSQPKPLPPTDVPPTIDPDEPITAPSSSSPKIPQNLEKPLLTSSLLSFLPAAGNLPYLSRLPLLSFAGDELSPTSSKEAAAAFAETFRRQIGGCTTTQAFQKAMELFSAADLFCLDDYNVNDEDSLNNKEVANEEHDKEDEKASQRRKEIEGKASGHGTTEVLSSEPPVPDDSEATQEEFRKHLAMQKGNKGLTATEITDRDSTLGKEETKESLVLLDGDQSALIRGKTEEKEGRINAQAPGW